MIPKYGYFTEIKDKEVVNTVHELLYNYSQEPSLLFRNETLLNEITFVFDTSTNTAVKCHSRNLLIYNKEEPTYFELRRNDRHYIHSITLNLEKEQLFYPWLVHQVFFAIHSPYDPVNPIRDGTAMKPGYSYNINVHLEVDHLLPHPYQTNCIDYEAKWKKNNMTGPRSQQMCREMCIQNYSMQRCGCEMDLTMYKKIENMCLPSKEYQHTHCKYKRLSVRLRDRKDCWDNCKEDCMKLKYISTIQENFYELNPSQAIERTRDKTYLTSLEVVYFKDPEVTILTHYPQYRKEDLFSHVGGLMGCWLGISVWAFVHIIEKTFLIFSNWMEIFRKKKQEIEKEAVFYPSNNNPYRK